MAAPPHHAPHNVCFVQALINLAEAARPGHGATTTPVGHVLTLSLLVRFSRRLAFLPEVCLETLVPCKLLEIMLDCIMHRDGVRQHAELAGACPRARLESFLATTRVMCQDLAVPLPQFVPNGDGAYKEVKQDFEHFSLGARGTRRLPGALAPPASAEMRIAVQVLVAAMQCACLVEDVWWSTSFGTCWRRRRWYARPRRASRRARLSGQCSAC